MASNNINLDIVYDQGKDLIAFYRNNPCIAAYDLLNVDLAPIQRAVFEDMWFKNFVIAVCSRGMGKTFLLGALSALSCLLYPGYRVGLIAPVFRQCLVVFPHNSGVYDTFWVSSGLKTTSKEMYDSIVPNITKIQSLKEQNTILSKWENNECACMSIETSKGFKLSGSIDHRVAVLNNKLDLIFKELRNIRNDYIAIKHGFNYFGNNDSMPKFDEFEHNWRTKDCEIPKELTLDLAYWMGLMVGDGCISISKDERKQRVDFVSEDQDLLDSFEEYLRKYFLIDKDEKISRDNRKNNTWEIEYYCKKLAHYLLKCGFTKTTALDKKIPDVLKKASREMLIAFLQGLMDTDGGVYIQPGKGCTVSFSTSSIQLAKEVQAVLLNLGIISNLGISKKACIRKLPQGNKPSKCAEAYKVRITGQVFLKKFDEIIGFRCKRKNEMLTDYLNTHFENKAPLSMIVGLPQGMISRNIDKVKEFVEQGLYFVKMVDKDYFFAPTVDIEVENEHCYWTNGFINHNSKMIFSEVEKLYGKSSILREACEKRPTRGSDTCYLKFKSAGGFNPSFIEALPLSDGSKIRGSRFYLIVIDELAQVPDKTLDMVIRPMGATTLEPMENVRRMEKQKKLIEMGLATEDDFDDDTVNKMIMASSGYYKFNHMWRRMKDYWGQMELSDRGGKVSQYKVWQVPYWDLPEGFLDKSNIEEAKRIMSDSEFKMEYEADMISDSEGFFKASLLDECTFNSKFSIELSGDPKGNYVIGVDPNQGGSDSCGITVIKMGNINNIVNVIELKSKTTQDITLLVQKLCKDYNVLRIFMDRGGGGKAVMDLLEEGYNDEDPILDRSNPDNKNKKGRHILEMINFNPTWISDANFTTLSMLEDKRLLFPEPPTSISDLEGKIYENLNVLKSQMRNIVVTQTQNGSLHFDTPKKGQRKDLYSSAILAAYGIRAIERELEEAGPILLYNNSGMIRPHNSSMGWGAFGGENNQALPTKGGNFSAAVLSGKKRIK